MNPFSQSLPVRDAIILVGGAGTRLASVVSDRAKPMADVGGRPFVDALVARLKAQGSGRIIMATGHKAESVHHYYKGREDVICLREDAPLGTAGAVINVIRAIPDLSDPFYVLNGDSFYPFVLTDFEAAQATLVQLGAVFMPDAGRYGTLSVDDGQLITAFLEKTGEAAPGLVNAGVYRLDKTYIKGLPDGPRSLERDVFPVLAEAGELAAVRSEGPMLDIGLPETYREAEKFLTQVGA